MATTPSLDSLRAKVQPETRGLLNYIWDWYLHAGSWPDDRTIYSKWPHPLFLKLLSRIDGNFIQECGSLQERHFELRPIGMLATDRGVAYEGWLVDYLRLARDVYCSTKDISLHSEFVGEKLCFDREQVAEFGMVLSTGVLSGAPGHTPDFSTWEARLPDGLRELGRDGDPRSAFNRAIALQHFPGLSVWLDERAKMLTSEPLMSGFATDSITAAPARQ